MMQPHNQMILKQLKKFHMASVFLLSQVLAVLFLQLAATQADTIVRLGSILYANDNSTTWNSSSGDFAFGFCNYPGQADQYLLAIWFAKIPDKTIVWSANASSPVPRDSKLELTIDGKLMLTSPGGGEIWSSKNNDFEKSSGATMRDTGNFVIQGNSSSLTIWESFRNPTNTILPNQVLNVGDKLSSGQILGGSFSRGKFELVLFSDRMVFREVEPETGSSYGEYVKYPNATQLMFNSTGNIYTKQLDNSTSQVTAGDFPTSESFYFRAVLDYDGTLTEYIHPKNSAAASSGWSIVSVVPDDVCAASQGLGGSGPCGFNAYCELGQLGKPQCGCPPGFSFQDQTNYGGCNQDDVGLMQQYCQDGYASQAELFDYNTMDGVDWPFADYEQRSPSTEFDCRRACSADCYCAVAIIQDAKFNNGTGTCWKKKLPLSNGRLNRNSIDRRALFKKLVNNASSLIPATPSPTKESRNQAILILSVLLGTSAFFNFFSVAGLFAFIHFFYQRKMYEITKSRDERDLETNLRSYSYEDLEKATNNFKEELGKGAFGTVYKGLLPSGSSNYVAVKKLDKIVQEGQKEFISEMKTISQTHHKNLVRLVGYCDEGENRLLVYELMQNGSLSGYLFGDLRLNWQQRVQIASGIAKGLVYLHEECSTQIIHCDIKPQNILLDDFFTAKISDFGLAKLLMHDQTRTLTGARGTKGYVAPEWFRNMPVTAKVDVYSYGVMLLEIICCRRCLNFELDKEAILIDWAYECLHRKRVETLVAGDEEAKGDMKRLEKFVMVAIWCVQDDPSVRPSMRTVSLMLEGIVEVPQPPCPFIYSSVTSLDDASSHFAQDSLQKEQSLEHVKLLNPSAM